MFLDRIIRGMCPGLIEALISGSTIKAPFKSVLSGVCAPASLKLVFREPGPGRVRPVLSGVCAPASLKPAVAGSPATFLVCIIRGMCPGLIEAAVESQRQFRAGRQVLSGVCAPASLKRGGHHRGQPGRRTGIIRGMCPGLIEAKRLLDGCCPNCGGIIRGMCPGLIEARSGRVSLRA